MSDWTTTGPLVLGFVAVLYVGRRAVRRRTFYPLPPGPPGLPWVGNVVGVNTSTPWITYAEWAKTYGDLVYSRLFGKDIIIINSEKIAMDLLESRSRNYSDRPHLIINDLCGVGFSSVTLPYGDKWRLHRRFFHQAFRVDAVPRFVPFQDRSACNLLRWLLDAPEDFHGHIFTYTGAIILNSAYGYGTVSRHDRLINIVESVMNIIVPILRPDISVVLEAFPWLLHLPSWFPGMSFKREMTIAREYSKEYLERPFQHALQKAPSSDIVLSMVHDALRGMADKGISPTQSWMNDLKEASGTAFLAASETSNSVLMTFFLMMLVNPEVQEKAHREIDALLGYNRLPTLEDRPFVPFIDAIFRETLRYSPVIPLSIPHSAVDEDVYDGFRIPKGALLMTNLWGMAHDESRYPNPHAFIPERFLNNDGSLKDNDIEHLAFGFGRRICVGRHLANNTVWLAMAKVLAVFKILGPLDENGVEIPVEPRFKGGIALQPAPFKCRIVPRLPGMDTEKLEQLIAASQA